MEPRRIVSFAFVCAFAFLTGCVSTTPKPAPGVGPDGTVRAASASTDPKEPLTTPPELMPKFEALLTGQGLSLKPASMGEAAGLTAAWNNKVVYAPDPTKGGDPMPCLVVRLWAFGPDHGKPVEPDGELLVALWDTTPTAETGSKPVLKELWHIDRETAAKFRKMDAIGDGYTVLLPWSNYHIDVKQVNLLVRYNGADGRNLASNPERLSIDHSATLQRAAELRGMTNADLSKAAAAPAALTPAPGPVAPRDWPTKAGN